MKFSFFLVSIIFLVLASIASTTSKSNRLHKYKGGSEALAAEITETTQEFTRIKRSEDEIVASIETTVAQGTKDLAAQLTAAPKNKDKKKAIDALKAAVNKINSALEKENQKLIAIDKQIETFQTNRKQEEEKIFPTVKTSEKKALVVIPWRFKLTRKHKSHHTHKKYRFGTLDEAIASVEDFQKEVTKLTKEKETFKIVLSNDVTKILTELLKIANDAKTQAITQATGDQLHDHLFTLKKVVESWKTSAKSLKTSLENVSTKRNAVENSKETL